MRTHDPAAAPRHPRRPIGPRAHAGSQAAVWPANRPGSAIFRLAAGPPALLAEERAGKRGLRQFFYSIKKEGDSRIFQAQDRAIDDFTLKGKPRNGSIDKF